MNVPPYPTAMKKLPLLVMACCAWAVVGSGSAAVLTGTVDWDPATTADLTTDGTLGWAIWNTTASAPVGSIGATNLKLGEPPGLFSSITPYGGGTVRGVGNATEKYTYTDGTSPTMLVPAATQGFVINSSLAYGGRGVQVSIQGNSSQLYHVEMWGVGFAGHGTMTATLAGAAPVALVSEIFSTLGTAKVANLFSFDFRPDNNADLLNLRFVLDYTGYLANAHVGIQGITVSAIVPEPATASLVLGGLALLLGIGRSRRRC